MNLLIVALTLLASLAGNSPVRGQIRDPGTKRLFDEVANKGWIIFAAKTEKGDYDLFVSRPNGIHVRNITRTPEFNELGATFFDNGKKIIYRRVGALKPKQDYRQLTQGVLVVADSDGSNPRVLGGEGDYPWATLSPDAKQMACLYKTEGKIRIFDFQTLQLVREMPRQGIFWQLCWSPDGKEFCGTANIEGRDWNIVTSGVQGGVLTLISRVLNCTPDWFPDSSACIFSHRNPSLASDDGGAAAERIGQDSKTSWTMIMMADRQGKNRSLVVAEQYRHLYFACLSPDGRYAIYCRLEKDSILTGPMAVIRMSDAPIMDGPWNAAQKQYARNAKAGPILRLDLPPAFDPHWTYARIGDK